MLRHNLNKYVQKCTPIKRGMSLQKALQNALPVNTLNQESKHDEYIIGETGKSHIKLSDSLTDLGQN